jgi:hypothetical protein
VFGGGFATPKAISSDGTHVWVANYGGQYVDELSAATGALVRAINYVGYEFEHPTAVSSDGTNVWVTNTGLDTVTGFPANPGDTVTVTTPGHQSNFQYTNLSVQVAGTSSGGHPLTWSATGLPSGLTIGSSSGLISGQITASPGSYSVTVSASDTKGAHSSVSFGWQVTADVGSVVTDKGSNLCLTDPNNSTVNGTPVEIETSTNASDQHWLGS